ncbi:hypothetical protein [Novosphingobium sp.]|jgi:hypothetical protein
MIELDGFVVPARSFRRTFVALMRQPYGELVEIGTPSQSCAVVAASIRR